MKGGKSSSHKRIRCLIFHVFLCLLIQTTQQSPDHTNKSAERIEKKGSVKRLEIILSYETNSQSTETLFLFSGCFLHRAGDFSPFGEPSGIYLFYIIALITSISIFGNNAIIVNNKESLTATILSANATNKSINLMRLFQWFRTVLPCTYLPVRTTYGRTVLMRCLKYRDGIDLPI